MHNQDTLERIEARHSRLVEGMKTASQTLMVAHGAALLTMLTTYAQPDMPLPPMVHNFLRILVTGLYFGIIGTAACLLHTIAWDRLHIPDKGHKVVFLTSSALMVLGPGISVLLLMQALLGV
jgi:hypothetical protein